MQSNSMVLYKNIRAFVRSCSLYVIFSAAMVLNATAHDASLTYSVITIDSTRIELKITIPMEVLSSILPDQDWYEPVKNVISFENYFNKNFVITNEGAPCQRKLIRNQCLKGIREYSFTYELTSDATFDHLLFQYNMIFEYSATHENIAEFMFGSKSNELIFSKEKNTISFSVNDLRRQWGLNPYAKKALPKKDSLIAIRKNSASIKDSDIEPKVLSIDTPISNKSMDSSAKSKPIVESKAIESAPPFAVNDTWNRFIDFFVIGIKHILTGYDHLMFLMGLLLLITGIGNLLKVITAFTVAHSITLAIAVFGIYALPSALTEIMIALSISFIAFENIYILNHEKEEVKRSKGILHSFIGEPAKRWRLTFLFGLIHGFGFSAALREIGMPEGTRAISLFAFNLGVEAGQLMMVGTVLPILLLVKKTSRYPLLVRTISIIIGIAGLALVFQRIFFPELF